MIENCCQACPTTQTVNVPGPQGDAGVDGVDGADGAPAFSVTAQDFTVAASVAVTVDSTAWMAVGQVVVCDGPVHFRVASVDSDTVVTLTQLNYPNDITGDIATGSIISPSGEIPDLETQAAYATGTNYTLTDSYAALNFGTVDPEITIATDGTYMIFARVSVLYSAATITTQTISLKLYKNGTTDIASSEIVVRLTPVTTTTLGQIFVLPVIIAALNDTDTVTIYGKLSAAAGAGTIQAEDADIVAIKIA